LDIVQQNPDKPWDWFGISANPTLSWGFIQKNPDKPWDWCFISENPNITWDIVQQNPDKPWDWDNSEERNERRNWMIIRRNAVGVL
jgi:hypothetical protein